MALSIQCGHCGMAVKAEDWNFPGGTDCGVCGLRVEVRAFPSIQHEVRGDKPETILGTDEAGCFYHPQNRAAVHCDACGRFLCNLCDLPLDGQHLCPQCVENNVRSGKLASADTRRTYHDSIALAFAVLPILPVFTIYFTVFTAPVSLYYVLRYWKKPQGILPRSKARFVIAGLIAVAQIIGWGVLFVVLIGNYLRSDGGIRD